MCGIAAVINGTLDEVKIMGVALNNRGLNSDVTEIDSLKVSFSLLPITDPSAPMQPFSSGPWVVWLNGYISNYLELAEEFNIPMRTKCDTELLAKLIDKLGYKKALLKLNGFFSIIAYDSKAKTAWMNTDRYGIKQLYTYSRGATTYIASEVKAILAVCPDIEISDYWAQDWLYSLGVLNEFGTIYRGVDRVVCCPFIKPSPINKIDYVKACDILSDLLDQSIVRNKAKSRLADGIFLSGGIDSGIIASRIYPHYSFSMDYLNDGFSEIQNIKLNSKGIHMTMIANSQLYSQYKDDAVEVLDDLKAGSCYTNFALTELASKFCTVLYSGAGGDEVFDGYTHRYNKPIEQVIKRTDFKPSDRIYPQITHKQYDWMFLKAILVVEDRMSGHHTMETRYPLLDNDFVDFALSLPDQYRENKKILKDISGLDHRVIDSPKKGFSNPHVGNLDWARFALESKRKH